MILTANVRAVQATWRFCVSNHKQNTVIRITIRPLRRELTAAHFFFSHWMKVGSFDVDLLKHNGGGVSGKKTQRRPNRLRDLCASLNFELFITATILWV